ncbi:carbon-nitrogen hydrolase family protein [Fusibacter ferrireducens]|uniref:Carbon-nitrogen hydrolase family protein n=1 Tax=Fusibacter ferrireducens TaxID=2785058 RepID=A0ABR9ZRC6_9FIRM|nr:carbon-nitrogen hydrolase family protein [Fusibacter ferrireducens]MBF4692194.1 carbon-nitrogen hydrolase family protein [Fusibacter ferrireducens]
MKDIITVSVVNFNAVWGDVENNRKRILNYVENAGKQGVDLLVFPETALTGYDNDCSNERAEKMHRRLAETVPGKTSMLVAEICKNYSMYAAFGLAERDSIDQTKVYNSVAVCGPKGVIGSNRKIHLPFTEMEWADNGSKPMLFDTEWGPIGVGICYDVYEFPEITRYCRAMGARLFLNCTAIGTMESGGAGGYAGNLSLQYLVHCNSMYIASSNLFGLDKTTFFMGGSSIIGPSSISPEVFYYAGKKFLDEGAAEGTVETATIDLSLTNRSFISLIFENEKTGVCDWRPEAYQKWYADVLKKYALSKSSE